MPKFSHTTLREFGASLFQAANIPSDQARFLSDHLVESNLMGHDSHGVIAIPYYIECVLNGDMRPVKEHDIVREAPSLLVINAHRGIGVIMAHQAMQLAVERAKTHTFGAVGVHGSSHIGRLGAFPPIAAAEDCIGILVLNGEGNTTAPFGGTDVRLPPNPIAMSVPTLDGPPLTLDMTTSMVAVGKVEIAHARNKPVPEGWVIDQYGNPTTNPSLLMNGIGAMLPLGGSLGHKGYGLAMMVDALAGGLTWAGCSSAEPTRGGNGFFALAIKVDSFIDAAQFKKEIRILTDWVKASPKMPGVDRIYVPGEIEAETRERRLAEGIFIEDSTWNELLKVAVQMNVAVPDFS